MRLYGKHPVITVLMKYGYERTPVCTVHAGRRIVHMLTVYVQGALQMNMIKICTLFSSLIKIVAPAVYGMRRIELYSEFA